MKEGLDLGFMKEGLARIYEGNPNTGFMKEGLDPNQHRIYEGRTRS